MGKVIGLSVGHCCPCNIIELLVCKSQDLGASEQMAVNAKCYKNVKNAKTDYFLLFLRAMSAIINIVTHTY